MTTTVAKFIPHHSVSQLIELTQRETLPEAITDLIMLLSKGT